jgi:hypothetical protein
MEAIWCALYACWGAAYFSAAYLTFVVHVAPLAHSDEERSFARTATHSSVSLTVIAVLRAFVR